MKRTRIVGMVATLGLLAACGPKPLILKGPRFDVRTPIDQVMAGVKTGKGNSGAVQPNRSEPARLPSPVLNADWPQRNGGPTHAMTQPALAGGLAPLWAAPIGKGNDTGHTITAAPVVAGGRIFTLDSRALVSATAPSGATLWHSDIRPAGDSPNAASGGGLAYGDGKLFVTSGFGELVALNPATGAVIWRQRFDAPVTGSPTVEGNTVYVVARDSTGWAVDTANGKVRWQTMAADSDGGVTGGAAPAVNGRFAMLPFPSGQLDGVLKGRGTQVWETIIAGTRVGQGYGSLTDITGDPVIVGNRVYVGNATGRMMALDANTGNKIWTADDGVMGPVWPAGNSVYLISDQAHLARLDAATGDQIWAVDLPYYKPTRRAKKRRDIFVHYGPILAGNRLLVASSDGQLRLFDPASGNPVGMVPIGGAATAAPVVAGGILYVVTADGQLRAFR